MSLDDLEICTVFDSSYHKEYIQSVLKKMLPQGIKKQIHEAVPMLKWFAWAPDSSFNLSLFLLCLYRPGVEKFFYDMIGHWLLPGKHLDIALHFSINFKFTQLGEERYTISELVLSFDSAQELERAEKNFFFIEKEILLGVSSFFHASRILEIKGLSLYDKTALIQERISQLLRKKPTTIDYDIFALMQHFLVSSKDEFKSVHDVAHMSRLIAIFYFFQHALLKETEKFPAKRALFLKIKKIQLHHPLMIKRALAIFVGINFLKENEMFEKRHLLAAIHHLLPEADYVEDSYFVQENKEDRLPLFYLEIEKKGGAEFSQTEIGQLRLMLPDEIKKRIEQLALPLFMPRNEEEVMRNILILSRELKFIKDLPQMIISFDEQSESELSFTVVLVRILLPEHLPLKELFANSPLKPHFERSKVVGMMRKKYPKEATVFRVKLFNEKFLRDDHSLDLYQARLAVAAAVQEVIGSVRDYNGGMISKQNENFHHLKLSMEELASKHLLLLQNFFYSIFPIEQSATLDSKILKNLFLMLLNAVEKKESALSIEMKQMEDLTLIMASYQDPEDKERFLNLFQTSDISSRELATTQLKILDTHYLGLIYLSSDPLRQKEFRHCFAVT
ncbi:MAG TPA: hypothetical protein VLF61_01440 [Rhabdochlamydiaceae bacterium]|nr:hypothetical protein [Rhabdochlamydiaceae bacterium]